MLSLFKRLKSLSTRPARDVALLSYSAPLRGSNNKMKVVMFGASGNLGTPLSLLLHQSPRLDELALVDSCSLACVTPPGALAGLADELNSLDQRARVAAYPAANPQAAAEALRGARLVILADAALRTPGETRRPRILKHGEQAATLAKLIAEHCPQAAVLVLTAPISGVVPVVVEAARRAGVRCPERRVLGVPAAAKARAAAMVGAMLDEDPFHIQVPITGGTSASAVVPLLSQVQVNNKTLTKLEVGAVVSGVQAAGARMARVRSEFGHLPALGVAHAAARFTDNVIKALLGERGICEHAFVACDVMSEMPYLTAPVQLQGCAGCAGGAVLRVLPLGCMTGPESKLLRAAARLVRRDLDVADNLLHNMFGAPELPPEGAFGYASSEQDWAGRVH